MRVHTAHCTLCLNATANLQSHQNSFYRKRRRQLLTFLLSRRVYHFKNLAKFKWWQSQMCICRSYQADCKQEISLAQTTPQLLAWSSCFILSLWKDDTAAQTPLNNENVLSGSNVSLAQPVSCQTVNAEDWSGEGERREWRNFSLHSRGFNAAVPAVEWPSQKNRGSVRSLCAAALESYNSSCLHNLYCMSWLLPATVSPPPRLLFPLPARSFHKCFFSALTV